MLGLYEKTQLMSERFNEDLFNLKENDDIISYLDVVVKTMEDIDTVKLIGREIIGEDEFLSKKKYREISPSRIFAIKYNFITSGLNDKGVMVKDYPISLTLQLPKLIEKQYFLINGVKYSPVFQLVDITYVAGSTLVLKTLTMGVFIDHEQKSFTSIEGDVVDYYMYNITSFAKSGVNFLSFYLAEYGIEKTFEIFGITHDDMYFSTTPVISSDTINFNITPKKLFLVVNKGITIESNKVMMITNLLSYMDGMKVKYDQLFEQKTWLKRLGGFFTKTVNNMEIKARKVLISFKRLVDEHTKNILWFIDKPSEHDSFTIVKFLIENFNTFYYKDNIDIRSKRLRFYEYMLMPFLQKMSTNLFRVFNKKDAPTIKDLTTMLKHRSDFIIKTLVTNDLIRYDNLNNGMDILNMIKCSQKGPQSLASTSKNENEIPIVYRSIHPSFIGRVSLVHSSASDPGMNFQLVPTLKLKKNMYFPEVHNNELDDDIQVLLS